MACEPINGTPIIGNCCGEPENPCPNNLWVRATVEAVASADLTQLLAEGYTWQDLYNACKDYVLSTPFQQGLTLVRDFSTPVFYFDWENRQLRQHYTNLPWTVCRNSVHAYDYATFATNRRIFQVSVSKVEFASALPFCIKEGGGITVGLRGTGEDRIFPNIPGVYVRNTPGTYQIIPMGNVSANVLNDQVSGIAGIAAQMPGTPAVC